MYGLNLYRLRNFSAAIFLILITGQCIAQETLQTHSMPERCTKTKPKASNCESVEKRANRRYILHPTKGCKISGYCQADVERYDPIVNDQAINYFITLEDCIQTCMTHVKCPTLEPIQNGTVSNQGMGHWGTKVSYNCNKGYSLYGTAERECQYNGAWSSAAPTCRVNCRAPSLVNLTNVDFAPHNEFYTHNETIIYQCKPPYMGEETYRTCQDDGTWSGTEPTCDLEVQCPVPTLIEHGKVHAPVRSIGSVLTYTCDPGYVLYGDATRTCSEKKEWTGEKPVCWNLSLELCDKIDHPDGVDITNTTTMLKAGKQEILIIPQVSDPNPFPDESPQWIFNPSAGVDVVESRLKITTVLRSGEQEGTYNVTIGGQQAYFTLVVDKTETDTKNITKPYVMLPPYKVSAVVGGQIQLSCIFGGCPNPDVTWYHNGTLIREDGRRQNYQFQAPSGTISQLTIESAFMNDLGEYMCVGSNDGGSTPSISAFVSVSNMEPTRGKRSLETKSLCQSKASQNTVTIVGRVKRELSRLRAPGTTVYRMQVNQVLGTNSKSLTHKNLRTIVIDTHRENPSRLKRNGQYILQGRVQDNTLLIYRHDSILDHSSELEDTLKHC